MAGKSFFADGLWNFFCDLCGAKRKSSEGVRTWDNFYVCRHHKEERNPQDFLRGVRDDQSVPWSRPEAADTFVPLLWTRGVSDDAVAVSDSVSLALSRFLPPGILRTDLAAINTTAVNGHTTQTWTGPLTPEQVVMSDTVTFTFVPQPVSPAQLNGRVLNGGALNA